MNSDWIEEKLNSIDEVLSKLIELRTKKKKWVFRGVSREHKKPLISSIDRLLLENLDRKEKIRLERQSIELFRSTYKQLAIEEDNELLREDITTLMLMQHYGAPTRLLDWSFSPYIAAYFAVCENDKYDGFIWGFEYDRYEQKGSEQWEKFPEMIEGGKFVHTLRPAFEEDYRDKEWFVCQFINKDYGFNRIRSQEGLFTFASQFNIDHSLAIMNLLNESEFHKVYRIRKEDKFKLRQILRNNLNIWHGMFYPDVIGSAEAVKEVMTDCAQKNH